MGDRRRGGRPEDRGMTAATAICRSSEERIRWDPLESWWDLCDELSPLSPPGSKLFGQLGIVGYDRADAGL